ncbi:protein kinase [Gemmata sp. JC717]|uniref:WD40 repeat domain-containing serine/threonine protein kinase n=1 Tax=Gemmata algarum TaxID=2975278 RepID=UPI0021BA9AA2|nr:protein kinase [Gemmata algarum]MDY3554938.1 protein kinase [Gemmata algarum]
MRTPASLPHPPERTVPLVIARDQPTDGPPKAHRVAAVPLPPEPPASEHPRVRGYDILSVVGTGGMGIVYEARHRELNRRVAIKMLRGESLAPEFRERFRAEAETIAKLQHPNVIQVFEVGTVEPAAGELHPIPFIALEFVDGGSLASKTRSPQAPDYAARTVTTLARAVHAAHQIGVIHRDLKPANVLLGHDGEPKIADFGIAKQIAPASGPQPRTQTGVVLGTPEYMSPEQFEGEAAPAADIYALGVILYQLLTGVVPFKGAAFADTIRLALHQEPVLPRRLQPGVPRDLETVCLKCLEKQPDKRYPTAAALADDLERWLDGRPILARRLGPLGRTARWGRRNPALAALSVVTVLVAVAALAGVMWSWDDARWNEKQAKDHMEIARTNELWAAEHARRAQAEAAKNLEAAAKERWERYRVSLMAASGGLRLHDVRTARWALDEAPPDHRDWVWNVLVAQLDRSRHVLGGPDAPICYAQFSANGRWLLATDPNRQLTVWDLTTRERRGPFPGPAAPHHALVADSGAMVAYATNDHGLALLDPRTGRVRVLSGHTAKIHVIQFIANGSELVTGSEDRTARIWNVETGRETHRLRVPDGTALPLVFSPDGEVAGARWASSDPPTFWGVRSGRPVGRIDPRAEPMFAYRFSPDGKRIVSSGWHPQTAMDVWEVATGQRGARLEGHENQVSDTAFSPDGRLLASCSMDRTVRVWDIGPDARGEKREAVHVLEGHTGWIQRVAFNPDGTRLLSASDDRTLRYWDVKRGKLVAVLRGHSSEVNSGAFHIDPGTGTALIASHASDDTVRLWDVWSAENDYALRGHGSYVYSAAFFPDGDRIASAGWDDTARVWDARTGKEVLKLEHGNIGIVSSVAVHPKGQLIATLGRKHNDPSAVGGVRLWDAGTGKLLHVWPLSNADFRDSRVTFSPDGTLLAAGTPDGRVRLWDVTTRRAAAVLEGHAFAVCDVAFSPDGKQLASAGHHRDGSVRVWDVATGKPLAVLKPGADFRDGVLALAWHPNGKSLAAGSSDGSVRIWDVATEKLLGELKHGSDVYGLAFSPDGKLLATGAADNLIRLWHVDTHREIAELSGHKMYVHSVAFDRTGTRLVSASGDKTVRVWDTEQYRTSTKQTN